MTRWERLFDEAVALAAEGRDGAALRTLTRLQQWQRRQPLHGPVNHSWHNAELLWLRGIVAERANQTRRRPEWLWIAQRYRNLTRRAGTEFLPRCVFCARRELPFAPSLFSVIRQLWESKIAHNLDTIAEALREQALANASVARRAPVPHDEWTKALPPTAAGSTLSLAAMKARRVAVRNAYGDGDQPATLVELCDQYLQLDPLDCAVWAWYSVGLKALHRYPEASAALQTARGLASSDEHLVLVLLFQGDLEHWQGRYADAVDFYRQALGFKLTDERALLKMGRSLRDLGDPAEAEACFRQAASVGGTYEPSALYELGCMLRSRSSFFEARRVLKQALTFSSDDEIRDCLADVERVIRLQALSGRAVSDRDRL